MEEKITIKKKDTLKGDDGNKVISVRIKEETLAELEKLSSLTNRSRNEVINILLTTAIQLVEIEE